MPETTVLLEASQALMLRCARTEIAATDTYCDLAIVAAQTRADPNAANASELAFAAEALVCLLDDRAMSGTPEWEALSRAVDAARKTS